jgi:Fe-S cluster assembly protein SufD
MNSADFLDRVDTVALTGTAQRRIDAAEQFRKQGWPTRANEAWHYTDLNAVLKSFILQLPAGKPDVDGMLPDTSAPRIVFVNGGFDEILSTTSRYVGQFEGETPAVDEAVSPMVALNAAIARDGVRIDVPAGVDAGTLFLISVASTTQQDVIAPLHRITVGKGGSLTVIEIVRGTGQYLHNPVIEIELSESATFNHYRLQDESVEAVHVATIFVNIATAAQYESFTLNCGARLSRNEVHVKLSGPRADVHLNAAQLLTGIQHGDITTVVAHDAPHCASRQTVKSVLAGSARGVFQGRIEVAQQAQQTDGYQMNQALLLSPNAEIDSKPELEIFADDVKCSHGATIGALDPEQMFYLRSRGIPEVEARAMLIRAFLDEALEPVTHEEARTVFETAIESWWKRGVV